MQTCLIHLLRNTFRYAARQYWDEMSRDLRPIYTAPTEAAAKERFGEFGGKWGPRYPAIVRMWENSWSEFVPFLDYGGCCRINGGAVAAGSPVGTFFGRIGAGRPCALSNRSPMDLHQVERAGREIQFTADTV